MYLDSWIKSENIESQLMFLSTQILNSRAWPSPTSTLTVSKPSLADEVEEEGRSDGFVATVTVGEDDLAKNFGNLIFFPALFSSRPIARFFLFAGKDPGQTLDQWTPTAPQFGQV